MGRLWTSCSYCCIWCTMVRGEPNSSPPCPQLCQSTWRSTLKMFMKKLKWLLYILHGVWFERTSDVFPIAQQPKMRSSTFSSFSRAYLVWHKHLWQAPKEAARQLQNPTARRYLRGLPATNILSGSSGLCRYYHSMSNCHICPKQSTPSSLKTACHESEGMLQVSL